MSGPTESPPSVSVLIRARIDEFLKERLQPKLDKLGEGEDEKRQKLLEDHRSEIWIADAAHRVSGIDQATHAIKYTHPDAKATSLNCPGNPKARQSLVGTHTLEGTIARDVVGNAAYLDVYSFLRLEVGGKSLLTRACAGDTALQAALSGDAEQARGWMTAFAGMSGPRSRTPEALSTHRLCKQVYWPLGHGDYHLLAPLFPTSLVHCVWRTVREDRFSDAAKDARAAYRTKKEHPHGFREYPDFAIQNFGGTKPQNISQLNSERHGENYLLASVPPNWQDQPTQPPLNIQSVFDRWFGRRKRVYRLVGILRRFLSSVQDRNNVDIRHKRAELVALIRDELVQAAAALQDLPPGWSRHEDCRLNKEECYWLDPRRGLKDAEDVEFVSARAASDWQDAICGRFGRWLNARLSTDKTPMGDPEYGEWHTVLQKELSMMREDMNDHD